MLSLKTNNNNNKNPIKDRIKTKTTLREQIKRTQHAIPNQSVVEACRVENHKDSLSP